MRIWAPYRLGEMFAMQKREWLLTQIRPKKLLGQGELIGRQHQLLFENTQASRLRTRIIGNQIKISMPRGTQMEDQAVQLAAHKASVRAIKKEAQALLPVRLAYLAELHQIEYRSVKIKELKSRWGSCTQHKDIVLNCYLMQLPDHLIDYVILHELLHTRVLAHGKRFWAELSEYVPNLPQVRKAMRAMKPTLHSVKSEQF